MMPDHSIYARDRSRIPSSIGSVHVQATKQLDQPKAFLPNNDVKCSEDKEPPMPSTFSREDYTMAGMEYSKYADKSSLFGTRGLHYAATAALVLFQDATLNMPLQKPPASSIGLNHTDPIIGRKSPCQDVHRHAKPVLRLTPPADRHLTTYTLKTYTLGGAQGTTLPRRVLLLSSDLQTSTSVQISGTSDEFFSTTYFSLPECVYDL